MAEYISRHTGEQIDDAVDKIPTLEESIDSKQEEFRCDAPLQMQRDASTQDLHLGVIDKGIGESKIADGSVTNDKLANDSITANKIQPNAVSESRLAQAVQDKLNGNIRNMISTTWVALKAMRDAGQLTAGQMYRITDYTCTTTQADTQSAGHAFDIVVTALDERTLDETASAIQHAGDTYFKDCTLEAWVLKYCIDNDTTRFAWADETNGKGVIYYMKDEWNNECPYDFKNIQFKRYKVTSTKSQTSALVSACPYLGFATGNSVGLSASVTSDFKWIYTFTKYTKATDTIEDASLVDGGCYNNTIRPLFATILEDDSVAYTAMRLNNIAFWANGYAQDASQTDTSVKCCGNTFGEGCYNITGLQGFYNNTFGNDCYANTFGNSCTYDTFDNYCYVNTFGNSCTYDTFGADCYVNIFGNGCNFITFGHNCNSNTINASCNYNTFGNDCDNNTFGNGCNYNTFGNDCDNNIFGNGCNNNTFESSASNNEVKLNYVHYFIVQNGVKNVKFQYTDTPSNSRPLENVIIKSGVAFDTPTIVEVDATKFPLYSGYQWTIAKNSNDEVKQYCEADLIQ